MEIGIRPSKADLRTLDRLYIDYLMVGGMPEAVLAWVRTGDMYRVEGVHGRIIDMYESEIRAHCPDPERGLDLLSSVPIQMVEHKGRFRLCDAGGRTSTLSRAMEWMLDSGMIQRYWGLTDSEHPPKPRKGIYFRLLLSDVGLLSTILGANRNLLASEEGDPSGIKDAVIRNYIYNELVASPGNGEGPYYWRNIRNQSNVDFLLDFDGGMIPMVIRSRKGGRIMNLEAYCRRYGPDSAIVTSRTRYKSISDEWIHVPLSLVGRFDDIMRAVQNPGQSIDTTRTPSGVLDTCPLDTMVVMNMGEACLDFLTNSFRERRFLIPSSG